VEYAGVTEVERPPAPVTAAVQFSMVVPVYAYDAAHVITVDEAAFAMVKDTCVAVDPLWFASPAYVASAVAVPAFVFDA